MQHINSIRACTIASLLLLSSCGGGGSDDSTATPAPTPAPTPSPTPSPTPAYTYQTLFDFSRDRLIQALVGQQITQTRYLTNTPPRQTEIISNSSSIYNNYGYLEYFKDSDSIRITNDAEIINFPKEEKLPPNEIQPLSYYRFEGSDSKYFRLFQFYGTKYCEISSLKYLDKQDNDVDINYENVMILGDPTRGLDAPSTGEGYYNIALSVPITLPNPYNSSILINEIRGLSINYSGSNNTLRLLTGPVYFPDRTFKQVDLAISSNFNFNNNKISGTISSNDGAFSGTFVGRLYGPQGTEFCALVRLGWNGNYSLGTIVGSKDPLLLR